MDKDTIIKTVQSMRNYIHRVNDPETEQGWDEIQSADYLLEQLAKANLIPVSTAVEATTNLATPYLNSLAALRGSFKILLQRTPSVGLGQPTQDECYQFTNDFRVLYNEYLKEIIFPGGFNE